MSVKAIAKGIRMSPRKVAVVASLVRGRSVANALTILENTPRRAAQPVMKVINSAKANADYNHKYKVDTLTITSISVTPGIRYKRQRPIARGQSHPFQLKTSHIFVEIDGDKREIKKPVSKKETTENNND